MRKTKEKGITLIALIITIIVMLILVVVTVNIAMNGGIFTKAKTARDDTAFEVEKEELMSFALGKYNGVTGIVNLDEVSEELTDTTKWSTPTVNTAKTELTVLGVKSGQTHTIYSNGNVDIVVSNENNSGNDEEETPFAFTKGTMDPFTLNDIDSDLNNILQGKEWENFGKMKADKDTGEEHFSHEIQFYNSDETVSFLVEVENEIIGIEYEDETNDIRVIYEYHFNADDDVQNAGWYVVKSTPSEHIYEELDISKAISFTGIVIPQDTSNDIITMLNSYIGDVFKFVAQ